MVATKRRFDVNVQKVRIVEAGAQRQRHVVPGVAVGDREHVEVVYLLSAGLEVPGGGGHHPAEALDGGVGGHRRKADYSANRPATRPS